MKTLQAECKKGEVFARLSVIKLWSWPVSVMADTIDLRSTLLIDVRVDTNENGEFAESLTVSGGGAGEGMGADAQWLSLTETQSIRDDIMTTLLTESRS